MVPTSRRCTKCGVDKPLPEFSKAPRGKYGHKSSCKSCDSERARANAKSRRLPEGEVGRRLEERRGDTKKCTKCGETKPRAEYSKAYQGVHGPVLRPSCKACQAARARQWFADNPERTSENKRRYSLQRYGLSVEEYDALFAAQNGACAICQKPETASRQGKLIQLPVDHCHTSGRVRGLLCLRCNRAIGLLGDDVGLLKAAIDYLERE